MKKNTLNKKEFLKKVKMSSLEFHEWEHALKDYYTIERTTGNARIFTDAEIKLFNELQQEALQTKKTKEEIITSHFQPTTITPIEQNMLVINEPSSPIEQLSALINKQIEINLEKMKEEIIENLATQTEKTSQRLHSIDSHLKSVTLTNTQQLKELHYVEKLMEDHHIQQQEKFTNLVQTIEENRITQLEISKTERDRFYQDVNQREAIFQELLSNFRQVAATKVEEVKTPWWKFWKF